MSTFSICPTFGVGYQAFTIGGLPLNAGLIYTYAAGGTTPQATYTTSAGNVANANPIVLGADGRPPSEVWLTDGQSYRFDVKDSLGNLISSQDNISGITSTTFTNTGSGAGSMATILKLQQVKNTADYGTIQQAITAAGSTGWVLIPGSQSSTETYTNASNIPVLDLRQNQIGVWSQIGPSWPIGTYPLGNDMVIRTMGPADFYPGERIKAAATTTASLSIGANPSVLVGSVVASNTRATVKTSTTALFSTSASLIIARGQTNEEVVASGNWSVVDGTHLSITCAKTHSGTTDIEQLGSTILTSYDLFINSYACAPAQKSGVAPLRVKDTSGNVIANWPTALAHGWPDGCWQWAMPVIVTGSPGTNPAVTTSLASIYYDLGSGPLLLLVDSTQSANARKAEWTYQSGKLSARFRSDDGLTTVNALDMVGSSAGVTYAAWLTRVSAKQGAAVTAANNLTLGNDGNYFQIAGATQINLILNTNWQGGSQITFKFNSTPTVKHNQAASGNNKPIILNGAVDFVAAANNTLTLVYDSTDSSWYELARKV